MFHASTCITSVAPSVARILGFAPPKCAGDGNPALEQLAADAFSGRKADRALLYNPDAIAHHLFAHYTDLFLPVLRHRRAPAVWWGEERLLFTTRYASVRQKYGAWAFLLGVMVYEFIVVFNNSMARENWPWLQTRVSPVLDWVMYLCFGFKILLGTKYNGRSMVCAGLLYFVARWVYFNGQNIWWLGLCVALLAAKV